MIFSENRFTLFRIMLKPQGSQRKILWDGDAVRFAAFSSATLIRSGHSSVQTGLAR
jgi:hypothetical protein